MKFSSIVNSNIVGNGFESDRFLESLYDSFICIDII